MSLEKSIFGFGKKITKTIVALSLTAILSSCPAPKPEPTFEPKYDYTTTITIIDSEKIDSEIGGVIEIADENSSIYGTELTIPANALSQDTTISVGEVNNPPALPAGLNYVGTPIDLESDGINFNSPLTIQIPYNDELISDAGLSDDSNLKLYSYNKSISNWEEMNVISVDTENNIVTADLTHFSYYAITGFNCPIPEDLGNPQPGDLLYSLGAFWDEGNPEFKDNWMPGHVGIYVGEKIHDGKPYNVIEAQGDLANPPGEIRRSYFNPISNFSGLNTYAGAREPKDFILTSKQRKDIVDYAEAQVGKPYAMIQTAGVLFGMARGSLVKGPNSFNCVGLAEKTYEVAGVNGGEGLVSYLQEDWPPIEAGIFLAVLTPAEQYRETKPATGPAPNIGYNGPAGGWIFYDKGTYSNGWRYLEAAPDSFPSAQWGTFVFDVPGAEGIAIGTGKQNTLDIITYDPLLENVASQCTNYTTINNNILYNDWFLPSKDELNQIYLNLKTKDIGNFYNSYYWSSSEYSGSNAWIQSFFGGNQDRFSKLKASGVSICPIRSF